ncbi:MAG: SprT family zinc-dependent metalloprotease [Pseudomonadota bacterium]
MTLRVSHCRRGVVLTVPRSCDVREARSFVTKNVRWIERHVSELPQTVRFEDGAIIPLRGTPHRLVFVGRTSGRGVVWQAARQMSLMEHGGSGTLLLDAPSEVSGAATAVEELHLEEPRAEELHVEELHVSGAVDHAPRRLRDWLIAQARDDITNRVAIHAQRLGLQPRRITIRDQSSRWGSCSSTGALSFSWRLVLAPPTVLDYVAAHEVAHLREMNHSRRFWDLVRRTMPEMDGPKEWLRENGAQLHAYAL